MELHTGKLIPVECSDIEKFLEFAHTEKNIALDSYYDSYIDQVEHSIESGYMVYNGKLFKVENTEHDSYGEIEGKFNPDGSVSYIAFFYNGSCGLTEALESVIKDNYGEICQ